MQILVQLYLKSSNGRIPAGSIHISINSISQNQTRETYRVEKCPDSEATVDMTVSCQCLN
jgi:hypothetical protein